MERTQECPASPLRVRRCSAVPDWRRLHRLQKEFARYILPQPTMSSALTHSPSHAEMKPPDSAFANHTACAHLPPTAPRSPRAWRAEPLSQASYSASPHIAKPPS